MESIKLSVCIPTYNRASILKNTLLNLLNQDLSGVEIIVSDNNSTDDTNGVVYAIKRKEIKYFKNNSNLGGTLNLLMSINHAVGEYVVITSDEDDLNISNIMMSISFCDRLDKSVGLIMGGFERPTGTKYLYKDKLIRPRNLNLYLYGYRRTYISGIVYRRDYLDLEIYLCEAGKPKNGYLGVFPHTAIINMLLTRYYTFMSKTTFASFREEGTHDYENVGFSYPWTHPKARIDQFNSEMNHLLSDTKLKNAFFSETMILNRFRIALGYIAGFYLNRPSDYYFSTEEKNNEINDLSQYIKYKEILCLCYYSHIKNFNIIYFNLFKFLVYLLSILTYYKQKVYLLSNKL
jgi:glycosyltransferase involved in cell wall biosynthesis